MSEHVKTVADWSRLAAFIDGEGSICIKAFKNTYGGARHQVVVQITNTDPALPLWLVNTFGVGHVRQRNRTGKWSLCYDWEVRGKIAIQLLDQCLPFFVLKAAQAEVVMRFNALGYHRRGRGVRLAPELVTKRDALKQQLHDLKKTNRHDAAKFHDKREIVHYA